MAAPSSYKNHHASIPSIKPDGAPLKLIMGFKRSKQSVKQKKDHSSNC
uniref:Uncharacterized protein n=1 Tax=Arundo donax TaxID=35708 RepID=A0A0A9GEM9_ARUDO